ncbi:hypothetical protein [Marinobacter fonticola]|uniref:hypothetical protein n=1 Tax=Marinobacter fonticola TaxID=2603215 RepID=UPI0011E707F1|nr:hypothetical protein [Marinobacter fonticola]
MGKLRNYQEQFQDVVEKGINAAEEQQKKLASKPFEYAEKLESEAREYSVKGLRKRYDGYSKSLFGQLRSFNTRVGSLASEVVARIEKETVEGADAVAATANEVSDQAKPVKRSQAPSGKRANAARKTTSASKTASTDSAKTATDSTNKKSESTSA